MYMSYKFEENDNYLVIYLEGQYIGGEETDKLASFLKTLRKNNKNKIILDLEKVTYLSSIVLGLFIKLNNEIKNIDGTLILINVNSTIMEIFKITQIDSSLHILKDLNEVNLYFTNCEKSNILKTTNS